tara:strand:- start:5207 stop:6328 length:1122 start_codon:yes stop_codon:yes gene_type:complete
MIDPQAPDEERYKFFGITFGSAIRHWPDQLSGAHTYRCFVCCSPDGIQWRRLAGPCATPYYTDTQNQMLYDSERGIYAAYLRSLNDFGRAISRAESSDPAAVPWPADYSRPWQEIFDDRYAHIDEEAFPTVLSADAHDPPDTDLYNPSITRYEGYYLSFPSVYRHYPEQKADQDSDEYRGRGQGAGFANDGPLEVQMAVSRDGKSFERPDRTPYVALGPQGSFDGGTLYLGVGMLSRGNEWYQYCTASPMTHGAQSGGARSSAIARLIQTRDRFMAVEADRAGGELTTAPVRQSGRHLVANADCGAMGLIRFELSSTDGSVVDGFSFDDCDPVDLNQIEKIVTWRGKGTLPAGSFRIGARLMSTRLYSLRFVG